MVQWLGLCLPTQGLRVWSLVGELRGFPGGSDGKESACKVGDLGSIPRLRRSPGEGKDYPRRERLPIPVFWPGEFHGRYSPWGLKESDTIEQLSVRGLRPHMPRGQNTRNIKQKQYCNQFNKDFKNGPHQKEKKKKRLGQRQAHTLRAT